LKNVDEDQKKEVTHQLLGVSGQGAVETISGPKDLGVKILQLQLLSEPVAIDPERALTSMKAWARFVQLSSSRERSVPFETLEE